MSYATLEHYQWMAAYSPPTESPVYSCYNKRDLILGNFAEKDDPKDPNNSCVPNCKKGTCRLRSCDETKGEEPCDCWLGGTNVVVPFAIGNKCCNGAFIWPMPPFPATCM